MKAHLTTILVLLIIIGGGYLICINFEAKEVFIGILLVMISVIVLIVLNWLYLIILEFIKDTFFH